MLILPGDPEFDATLATPPPDWRKFAAKTSGEFAFVARAGSGILEPVTFRELDEYIEDGEYDDRLAELDDDEDGEDDNLIDISWNGLTLEL